MKMRKLFIIGIILVLFSAGVLFLLRDQIFHREEEGLEIELFESSATPRAVMSEDQLKPVIEQFLDEMRMFGNNKDQIIETLGEPLGQRTYEESGPEAYAWIKLEYEGLEILAWSDLMHDQYVNYMSISSEKYFTRFGIRVGSPVEKVVEFLGEPTEKKQGQMIYIYDMAVTDGVIRFHIANDIITEIEWDIGII